MHCQKVREQNLLMVRFIIWLRLVESIRYLGNYADIKVISVPRVETARFMQLLLRASDEATNTYVEPDISVICNPDKLDDKGCTGAPDWIIEICFLPAEEWIIIRNCLNTEQPVFESIGLLMRQRIRLWYMIFVNGDMAQYTLQDSVKVGIYEDLRD